MAENEIEEENTTTDADNAENESVDSNEGNEENLVTDSTCIIFIPLNNFLTLRAGISPNLPLIFNLFLSE